MTHLQIALEERVQNGLIRTQTDGNELTIYNYTEQCQNDGIWDEYTSMARGLILNQAGDIVARPFEKFFNLSETNKTLEDLSQEHGYFSLEDKLDGSLGILYFYYNQWNMATRGSFTSDQAIEGKKILDEVYLTGIDFAINQPNKECTHLFEIIYPENRIVLNYHGARKLIYLGSRNRYTGVCEYDIELLAMFEVPIYYPTIIPNEPNKEGYVAHFKDDYRVKIKHEEYVRLHRIMTGLTPNRIWDMLRHAESIDLAGCPEEFKKEVELMIAEFKEKFKYWYDIIEWNFKTTDTTAPRREIAQKWMQSTLGISGALFSKLDGKPYDDFIWKKIKPKEEHA